MRRARGRAGGGAKGQRGTERDRDRETETETETERQRQRQREGLTFTNSRRSSPCPSRSSPGRRQPARASARAHRRTRWLHRHAVRVRQRVGSSESKGALVRICALVRPCGSSQRQWHAQWHAQAHGRAVANACSIGSSYRIGSSRKREHAPAVARAVARASTWTRCCAFRILLAPAGAGVHLLARATTDAHTWWRSRRPGRCHVH